ELPVGTRDPADAVVLLEVERRLVPGPLLGEETTGQRRRAALIQGPPGTRARPDLDGLPLRLGAAPGRVHELPRLPAERVRLALLRAVVGLSRDVHHAPELPVLGGQQPPGEVVVVPAGEDQDDRGARREAGRPRVRPPVPRALAVD